MSLRLKQIIPAIVLFIFFFSLYVYTSAPDVHDGDSGEFATAVNKLGLAHSTGFPLYMLIGKSVSLFGGNNIARTLNILSSFFIATSVVLLFFVLNNFNIRPTVSLISAIVFGFGKSVWYHAGVAAVYPVGIFFIILLLMIFSRWYKDRKNKYIYWYTFVWGLSFGTHSLMTTLVFPLVIMIWENRAQFCKVRFTLNALALFLAPFIQYIYLPIAYNRNTLVTFGSLSTFEGFLHYITHRDYAFKIGARGISDVFPFLKAAVGILINEHGPWFFMVGIIGLITVFKKESKVLTVLLVVLLTNFTTMFSYGSEGQFVFLHRHLYPSYIIMTIFTALGADWLSNRLFNRRHIILFQLALIVGLMFTFRTNFAFNNLRNNYVVPDLSHNILKTVKENSILVVDGDSVTGPLWYFQSIGQRNDIIIINANMLVLDWYVENMSKRYPEVVDSGLLSIHGTAGDERLLSLIYKNLPSHNIYIAVYFSKNLIQTKKFDLFPMGVLYQVFPGGSLNMAKALEESSEYWNGYSMRNVKKSENYSFQINAIIKYYIIMLNNLGTFYFNNKQPQTALKYFEQAFAIDSLDVLTNNNLKNMEKYLDNNNPGAEDY